jgi:hypothetical protein
VAFRQVRLGSVFREIWADKYIMNNALEIEREREIRRKTALYRKTHKTKNMNSNVEIS